MSVHLVSFICLISNHLVSLICTSYVLCLYVLCLESIYLVPLLVICFLYSPDKYIVHAGNNFFERFDFSDRDEGTQQIIV
jgi:hypothetical protein